MMVKLKVNTDKKSDSQDRTSATLQTPVKAPRQVPTRPSVEEPVSPSPDEVQPSGAGNKKRGRGAETGGQGA